MIRTFLTIILVVTFSPGALFAAAKAAPVKKLCVSSDGTLTLRARCKKTETTSDLSSLLRTSVPVIQGAVGPQGPQGATGGKGIQGNSGSKGEVSVSSCRQVVQLSSNIFDPTEPTVVTSAVCNQATEFMLSHAYNANSPAPQVPGFVVNSALRNIVWAHDLRNSTGTAYGVDVTATRVLTNSAYVLSVKAICCPKS